MAVRQSIFGIGLQSPVLRDSPSSFESEYKWWFLKITNFDGLYWLLQMPLFCWYIIGAWFPFAWPYVNQFLELDYDLRFYEILRQVLSQNVSGGF